MTKGYQFISMVMIVVMGFSCSVSNRNLINPPKEMKKGYVYVPNGWAYCENDSTQVNAFFISKYETNNLDYQIFLNELKKQGRQDDYLLALPDTAQWHHIQSGEPYAENYFRHPAYRNYPVVNISHAAAVMFCEWLTQMKNSTQDEFVYEFRLPTRHEWLRAAQAGQKRMYAWDSMYLRDETGIYRANFKPIPNELLTIAEGSATPTLANDPSRPAPFTLDENGNPGIRNQITTPVNSFEPNAWGIYNMNGNAAEMLAQPGIAAGGSWNSLGYDIRNEALMPFDGPNPFTGFRIVMTAVRSGAGM